MFQRSYILLTYAGESHGENLFFSLTHMSRMERIFFFPTLRLEPNFCFDLVCKVVVEVQKEFYSFHLSHG
jgi:hypothetical protein